MLVYSNLETKSIEPSNNNISYVIVKQFDDNDLNIIDYSIQKSKIQTDIKNKKKNERKNKKNTESNEPDLGDTTESMINDIMIITSYTQDVLNNKNYKDLRQLAKSNGIRLSYTIKEDGKEKRINKTRQELIDELLKIKK